MNRTRTATAQRSALDLVPELGGHLPPEPRVWHRALRWLWAGAAVVLVAAVVAGGLTLSARATDPFRHEAAPDVVLPAQEVAQFAAWSRTQPGWLAPVVLTYHDIRPDPVSSPYVVTPVAFARQLAMLQAAGYRTLRASQFLAYRQGRYTPPPRSVLITFDDGTAGLWRYADSILEKYGFTAVSFLITQRVGTRKPYYLTWDLVQQMSATGRWDFESHTANLHTKIRTANGTLGGALSHRMQVNGRWETQQAFEARVRSDLERSISDITAHGLPRPELFAYPFSDVVAKGAEGQEAAVPRSIVSSLFPIAFVDVEPGALPASRREVLKQVISRAEVFHSDDELSVFHRLQQMATLPVSNLDPLATDGHWFEDGSAHPAPVDRVGDRLGVDAQTETYVYASWAPQRTSDWVDYAVSADVHGLSRDGGTAAGLRVRVGSGRELQVEVSAGSVRVSRGSTEVVGPRRLPARDTHVVTVVVGLGTTRVVVDGTTYAVLAVPPGPSSYGGFGVLFYRHDPGLGFPSMGLHVSPAR